MWSLKGLKKNFIQLIQFCPTAVWTCSPEWAEHLFKAFGDFCILSQSSVLHGLLLFPFCCSSPSASMNRLVLLRWLDVLSAGSSPREGLVSLVGDVSRPFASSSSCGAGVMDKGAKQRRGKGKTRCFYDCTVFTFSFWKHSILVVLIHHRLSLDMLVTP